MASRAVVSLAVFGAAVVHGQSHTVSLLLDDLPVEEPATLVGSIVAVDDDKTTAVVECASDVPLSECPLAFEPQTITQAASLWEYELVGEPSPGAGTQTMLHMMCELDASVGTCGLTGLIETTTTTFEFDISPHLYAVTVTAGAELLDGAAATEPSSSGDEVGGGGDDGAEDAAPLLGSGRSVIVAALVAVSVAGLL